MVSKRDILEISCKVLGLVCLVRGIAYFSPAAAFTNRHSLAYLAGPFVCYLASAFILLKWASGIASLLTRSDEPVELKAREDWKKSLYTLSLRVVGAVVLVRAVPTIVRDILIIVFRSRIHNVTPFSGWISLVWAIVYLALGIYFIGGAKDVVRVAMRGSLRESDSHDM